MNISSRTGIRNFWCMVTWASSRMLFLLLKKRPYQGDIRQFFMSVISLTIWRMMEEKCVTPLSLNLSLNLSVNLKQWMSLSTNIILIQWLPKRLFASNLIEKNLFDHGDVIEIFTEVKQFIQYTIMRILGRKKIPVKPQLYRHSSKKNVEFVTYTSWSSFVYKKCIVVEQWKIGLQ